MIIFLNFTYFKSHKNDISRTFHYAIQFLSHPNKLPILDEFFQNNVGCQNNQLPRVKTKEHGMKKAKYLS